MSTPAPRLAPRDAGTDEKESLVGQATLIAVGRTLSSLMGIALPVTLARTLDQTSFGEYRQLFLIAATLQSLFGLGIPASLYYFVPRSPRHSQRILERSALALGALGLVGAALVAACAPLIAPVLSLRSPMGLYLCAAFIAVSMPAALATVAPTVDRRMLLAAQTTSAFELLRVGVMAVVAVLTRSVSWVLVAAIGVGVAQLAFLGGYLLRRRSRMPAEALPETAVADADSTWHAQRRYSLSYYGAIVVNLIREQAHAFVVAGAFDTRQFALYSVGTTQIPLVPTIASSVHEVALIRAAGLHERGQKAELRELWWSVSSTLFTWSLPLVILVGVFARDLVVLAFGAQYESSANVLRVFAWNLPSIVAPTHILLRATGRTNAATRAEALSLLLALASVVPLLRWLGPLGAATSVVIGHISFHLFAAGAVREELSLSARNYLAWQDLGKVMANALASSTLAWLAFAGASGTWRAILGVPLAALLYALGAWKGKLLPAADRDVAARFVRRLRMSRSAG